MIITEQGTLLSAESKPYNVNGNEGISHKIRVLIDGQIFPCKSSSTQVAQYKSYENKYGEITISLTSRKEALVVDFMEFVPQDQD